jgi:hypothetical protein
MKAPHASRLIGVILAAGIVACFALGLAYTAHRAVGWSSGWPQSRYGEGGVHSQLVQEALSDLNSEKWNWEGSVVQTDDFSEVAEGAVVPDAVLLATGQQGWEYAAKQLEFLLHDGIVTVTTEDCRNEEGCDYHECKDLTKHCGQGSCLVAECDNDNQLCEALCKDYDDLKSAHVAERGKDSENRKAQMQTWLAKAKDEAGSDESLAMIHAGYAAHFAADEVNPSHLGGMGYPVWKDSDWLACFPYGNRETLWEVKDTAMLFCALKVGLPGTLPENPPGKQCLTDFTLDEMWSSYGMATPAGLTASDWLNDVPSCAEIGQVLGNEDCPQSEFKDDVRMALDRGMMLAKYIVADVFDLSPPSDCWASNSATVTDIANPDAYSCSQPGFLDFEGLPDETNLSALSISGIHFTTTGGYTWIVSDTSTGKYNGKYPNGAYMLKGTNAIWLGEMQGAGRIDFTTGPASYFSVLTSNYSQVYVDAYDATDHLLATAGPAQDNLWTGHMAELRVTRATPDIAYVMIHDTGNLWIADAICTNAPGVPGTISHLVDNTHQMQTGDHASGSFLVNLLAGIKHYLHILVGPFFSDVDLVLTRPDGTIVAAGDPGVVWDKGTNSIEVGIDDAQAGEWHYEIIANQLEAGGEDIHITVDDELIAVANEPPTLTIPGDQAVQYSDPLTFGVAASDLDAGDVLTLSASGLPATLTFVDNGDGTGAVSGTAQVAAGSYPVTFSVSDGVNAPVSAGLNIVVGKEDATLAYSGDALVKKGSPVMLKASVSELPDGSPGDISQAAVFFDVTAAIGGGTTTYGPAAVSASGEATWTFPTGLPANVYSVGVRMDPANTYYQAPSADTAALVVYDPSAGFTVGGGWVMDGGAKGNFGFSVKYLKSGTIQGQALYVYRSGDVVTRVKSNAMRWLVISGKTAVLRGKATVNGAGNYTFEITVVDNGEPGRSDTFAIKIWQPDGTLLHEVPPMTLGGGNVIVPQPKGR